MPRPTKKLVCLSRVAEKEQAAPADQWRDRCDQPRGLDDPELGGTAAHIQRRIRARLLELHERLKVDFPVYAVFTKGDLVAGFMEYFAYLNEQGRQQVWGATFQTADKSRNMVSEVGVEYDALLERLSEETLDRLQDEPVPNTRVLLFGFPAQMARLKQSIHSFLSEIFEPTRYHANATLRGFYFTSGTQQGTPIDQLHWGAGQELWRRRSADFLLLRARQKLFPSRPHPESHHRRSRMGFKRSRGGAHGP